MIPLKVKTAGKLLANIAHNLSQDSRLDVITRELLKELQVKWDSAVEETKGSPKRNLRNMEQGND